MEYLVELAERAARDLEALYEHIQAAESIAATRWYNGLEQAVYTLNRSPRRCPAAPEGARTHRRLRHLLYGGRTTLSKPAFQESDHAGR
jgi:toxin ParE1/3/4